MAGSSHSTQVRAILWDFDGTLVDTRRKNFDVARAIIESITKRPWKDGSVADVKKRQNFPHMEGHTVVERVLNC